MERTVRITKRYGRRISHDYQSWEFLTEISKDVVITSEEDLVNESAKLFSQVKSLTLKDIEDTRSEIGPQKVDKNNVYKRTV